MDPLTPTAAEFAAFIVSSTLGVFATAAAVAVAVLIALRVVRGRPEER